MRWRFALLLATTACNTVPTVDVEVSTGKESGVFDADPKIVRVEIEAKSPEGDVDVVATAAPGGAFELGDIPDSKLLTFDVRGVAADDAVVARGRSLSILIGSLKDGTLPVFVQRLGGWSRPLGALGASHLDGVTAVLAERYLVLTGGTSAQGTAGATDTKALQFYDLLSQAGASSGSDLPRVPRSLVMRGNRALVIDEAGATWVDFSGSEIPFDVEPPSGLTFADVAGGAVIENASGAAYVVGATRSSGATDKILVVDESGLLSTATLTHARVGAAAAYASVGLVVAGGSADAPGLEILPDDKPATPLPYAEDATEGATLVVAPNDKMILGGGRIAGGPAPTRILDVTCLTMADCVAESVPEAPLDALASRGRAFALTNGAVFVGDDEAGVTHSFRVTFAPTGVAELPLREPRKHASVVAAPNGTLVILGGELVSGGPATSVESYFPE